MNTNKPNRIVCPKCHYLRKETDTTPLWQCPNCGIVYAKYEHPSVQIKRYGKKKSSKGKLSIHTISFLAGFIVIALLVIKKFIGNIDVSAILMAIILYISIIPVLSVLLGDSLYVWNKQSMAFEAYDKTAHPILTTICFIVSFALSALMILLLFDPTLLNFR